MKRWHRHVIAQELRQVFSYRVDFWAQYLGSIAAQVGVAFFLWTSIFEYRGVNSLEGYSFSGLMFFYLMVPLVDRLVKGFEGFFVSTEIYDGSLTRYLVYPVSFFQYKYMGQIARAMVSLVQMVVAVSIFLLFFGRPEEVHFSLGNTLLALSLCFVCSVGWFFLATALEMVAFWAENVWSLMVFLKFVFQILGGTLVPLEMYPEWARAILVWTPFPYFVNEPIRLISGQHGFQEWQQAVLVSLFWAVVSYIAARLVWRGGTRQYTGVGM